MLAHSCKTICVYEQIFARVYEVFAVGGGLCTQCREKKEVRKNSNFNFYGNYIRELSEKCAWAWSCMSTLFSHCISNWWYYFIWQMFVCVCAGARDYWGHFYSTEYYSENIIVHHKYLIRFSRSVYLFSTLYLFSEIRILSLISMRSSLNSSAIKWKCSSSEISRFASFSFDEPFRPNFFFLRYILKCDML